jgi:5'-nucleotidase
MHSIRRAAVAASVVAALATASVAVASPASAAKAKKPATITVLVTNDDGVGAPGIDALVEALRTQKNTKVVVVAPDSNKTSTGGSTTEGTLITTPTTTASGYEATAVTGFPADTITAALDQLGVKPNVVMSGINAGYNYSTAVIPLSGTIGAARMAAKRGIPAVAFSQDNRSTEPAPQYAATADLAVAWLQQHRAELAKKPKTAPTTITSFNVPNCPSGKSRGVLDVKTATDLTGYSDKVDCRAKGPKATTDVAAALQGYAAVTQVPLTD